MTPHGKPRMVNKRCLDIAVRKTETLLVTDRRVFKNPVIMIDDVKIKWKKQLTCLEAVLEGT